MVMKKLIAISVVFALVAGTAFAVDLSGSVIGTVNVLEGSSVKDSKVTSSASMNRLRLDGSGENDDGTFGGYIRAEAASAASLEVNDKYDPSDPDSGEPFDFSGGGGGFSGYAWWKPIDQLKIWIGSNGGDGFFGKEGYTGWMFYQTVADTGVVKPGNTWGGGYSPWPYTFRHAFYGGGLDGQNAFYATISPAEIVDINLEVPFFNGGEVGDVFKALIGQVSLNFDFGNIALTYAGDSSDATNGNVYIYFNLSAVDKLSLDVGVGLTIPGDREGDPIFAGLGAKYDITDAFGLKARVLGGFGGDNKEVGVVFDVLPYFAINDSITAFLSGGVTVKSPDGGDAVVGFHVNPYVQIGQEWGPKFVAGFQLWSEGDKDADDKAIVKWGVPVAINVSF